MTSVLSRCRSSTDEEREQVERLRWPSRGYLQELSEYQHRRRQIRKSRCNIMWPLPHPLSTRRAGENKETGVTIALGMKETRVWLLGRRGILMYFIYLNFDLWTCDIKRIHSHRTERSPWLGMWCHVGPYDTATAEHCHSLWKILYLYHLYDHGQQLRLVGAMKMIKPQSVKQGRVKLIFSRDTVDIILSRSTMVFHGEIISFIQISGYSCNITWMTLQVFIFPHEIIILNFMQLFL